MFHVSIVLKAVHPLSLSLQFRICFGSRYKMFAYNRASLDYRGVHLCFFHWNLPFLCNVDRQEILSPLKHSLITNSRYGYALYS